MANFFGIDVPDWLPAAAGGVIGGLGSQGATQTSQQSPYFRPFQEDIANNAQQLFGQGMPVYQGQTWAGPTPDMYSGWDAARSWAGGTPYSQQLGSAAQQLMGGSPFQANQQWADNPYIAINSPNASNPYIGQQSQGIAGMPGVSGLLGGPPSASQANVTNASAYGNPMLGMDSPYLSAAINNALGDIGRNYNLTTAPQRQSQMQASGSFGNAGVQQMQNEDQRNLQQSMGQVANNMRMQDYTQQQQLAEADAARRTGISQYNAGSANQVALANAAARNAMSQFGYGSLADLGKFDVTAGLGTQQFNANLGAGDLARNANLYGNMSQFNVGNQVGDVRQMQNLAQQQGQFNAGQGNAMNQYNAGQTNAMNQYNTGELNANSRYNAGLLANMMPMGFNFQNAALNRAQAVSDIGGQQRAINQQQLDIPYQNWQMANYQWPMTQYDMMAKAIGVGNPGASGQTQTQYPGSPLMGALGGAQLGSSLWNAYSSQPSQYMTPVSTYSPANYGLTGGGYGGGLNLGAMNSYFNQQNPYGPYGPG